MSEESGAKVIIWPEQIAKALARSLGKLEIEVSDKMIAQAIAVKILEKTGGFDDAGCDWMTDEEGFFVLGEHWVISENVNVGKLVDAMNIIKYGKPLKLEVEDDS
jgi:hypothetical protein